MSENYWQLVSGAKAGDRQSMVELYAATNLDTYRAVYAITASETLAAQITAQTYEAAFTNFDKLGDHAQFPSWCRIIGENISKNHMQGAVVTADRVPDAVPFEVNKLVMAVVGKLAVEAPAFTPAPVSSPAPAYVPAPAAAPIQTPTAAPAPKKKKGIIIIIALLIIAIIAGGLLLINSLEKLDDDYDDFDYEDRYENQPADDAPQSEFQEAAPEEEQHYAMMNEEAMAIYEAYGYGFEENVCGRVFADITHDGIPELITVIYDGKSGIRSAKVQVYTIHDGEAGFFCSSDDFDGEFNNIWLYNDNGKDYLLVYSYDEFELTYTAEIHIFEYLDVRWDETGHSFTNGDIATQTYFEGFVDDRYQFIEYLTMYADNSIPLIDENFFYSGGSILCTDVFKGEVAGFGSMEEMFGPAEERDTGIPIEHLLCSTVEEVFATVGEGRYDRGSYMYDGLEVHQYYGAPDNFVINGRGYSVYGLQVGDSEDYAREIMAQFPTIEGYGDINVAPPDWHYKTDGVNSQNYFIVFCENGIVTKICYGMVFYEDY